MKKFVIKREIFLFALILIIGFACVGCSSNDSNNSVDNKAPSSSDTSKEEGESENSLLEWETILSDKVEILIPKSFSIMSDEMAEFKYPMESRPTIIYTDEAASVNVAFNYTDTALSDDQISDFLSQMEEMVSNLYPSADWKNVEKKTINENDVGVLEFVSPAIDTEIYNLIWFCALDGRLLISTFNCTLEQLEEWEPIGKEIMESFTIK